jgi:peptide/nickel transport system substrate-binding protein
MKKRSMWFSGAASLLVTLTVLHLASPWVFAQSSKGVMKGALHIGIAGDWVDPSISLATQNAYFPLYLFHDSLLKPMPNDMYSPSLAESWTVTPDQKVYEFKLRKGVKFHNGDEMTAEDVAFTFNRYKGTGAKLFLDKTEKVEAVSPYLVRITFKTAFPDFFDYLLPGMSTISWVVPKKYILKVGDAEYKRRPIGCGPYKFVEFVPGLRLLGEAFEEYWRKVPHVKRLEFYPVEEISSRFAKVKTGEVDFALSLKDVYYDAVLKDPHLRMVTITTANHWILYLASQWDPKSPWSDARVRKAASLAIDRQALRDVVFPGGDTIGTIFLTADPETVRYPPDPYDPGQAKQLLAEAGYPKGFQGGKFYPQGGPHLHMGEMVATFWKAVGINVEIGLFDQVGWQGQRWGGKMKGAIFNESVGNPTISARLSYVLGPGNYGNYPDIQALWEQHERSVDRNVRKDLRGRMQKLIYDKTMFIPLMKSTTPSAFGRRIKGEPFKIREPYPIWYPSPMEDLELND